MHENIIVGIDLGTTNSCAAIYIDGQINIIQNAENERTTPSVVSFTVENTISVGKYAKKMAAIKPEYAVQEIKRLIGRTTDDPYVQINLKYFPFKLDKKSKEPFVIIGDSHSNTFYKQTPVEISSIILKKIKNDIEKELGYNVNKAVITIPAYFNVNQRKKTLEAAVKAGFSVPKLFHEPTAAAVAYFNRNNDKIEGHYLVYDLGGGTFDVAILKKQDENITILGTGGNSHLGGQDFDNQIVDYVCEYMITNYNYDPRVHRRAMRRLHAICEEAKKTLSVIESTTIGFGSFIPGHNDYVEIPFTRKQFEDMIEQFLRNTIVEVENCLDSVRLSKSSIKEVILCGGSTRIPKVQEMLSQFFGGKSLNKFVNPDECVAEGAAIQAAMLSSNPKQKVKNIEIVDVVPLSIGFAVGFDVMSFEIKRNTRLPATTTSVRVTGDQKQTTLRFRIYEGERLQASKNRFLGELLIDEITPAPPGQCKISVTMTVDTNGILSVTAQEEHRNNIRNLKLVNIQSEKSDKNVKNALKDAKENEAEDLAYVRFAKRKEYLLQYCTSVVYNMRSMNLKAKYKDIYDMCRKWKKEVIDINFDSKTRIEEMIEDVTEKCNSVVQENKFTHMPIDTFKTNKYK